jgi:hypothetical protein
MRRKCDRPSRLADTATFCLSETGTSDLSANEERSGNEPVSKQKNIDMPALHLLIPTRSNKQRCRFTLLAAALLILLAPGGPLRADLQRARAERNLEKRSGLALQNAVTAYQSIRAAYERGETERVAAGAAEIEESVNLAHDSLTATGKDPRKSPKWFKRAEIDTRDLLRKLDGFQQQMSFLDRHLLDRVRDSVQRVHDELLIGLMQGKRK